MLSHIMHKVPVYPFFILLYLLFIGWRATKPRVIWVPQLFLIPLILTISKFTKLLSTDLVFTITPLIAGIVIGTMVGIRHSKIEFLYAQNSVRLPGSKTTLGMFLILFAVKSGLNAAQTIRPDWCATCMNFDTILTFLFAGYSFSKAMTYTLRFIQKKHHHRTNSR